MTADAAINLPDAIDRFEHTLRQLEGASRFAKISYQGRVLELARRLLALPGGIDALCERAGRADKAGLFHGSDWAAPATLLPRLVGNTLRYGERRTVVLECMSLLRFLSVAEGRHAVAEMPAEQARHFLTQVLALNLDRVFGTSDEASRLTDGALGAAVNGLFAFLLDRIGTKDILGKLVDEIWRILGQRPLQVLPVKEMITQIAVTLARDGRSAGEANPGARRLIAALFGPTALSADDPGADAYRERLAACDAEALAGEAREFASAMHETGLVSDYHVVYARWLLANGRGDLLPHALGLSTTGLDALNCYEPLVHVLVEETADFATPQSLLGLALMLERGILYSPPIAPSFWRLLTTPLSAQSATLLTQAFGPARPAKSVLLAGMVELLGQPLGVGQGNNPTCQSARALSMWALNDPDYLFFLVAQVTRLDRVVMHFEGRPLDSALLPAGLTSQTPLDTDPVSVLLVPHLDRIYAEMGRQCAGRGEDPHRFINPELHGWWVGRAFHIAVDVATGALADHDGFLRSFFAAYHPMHNGNQPVIHPQPAGIAVTDSNGHFVGWHAISIIRVALDQSGTMRVYFFNPNNDSGQDWGHGAVVSTGGNGERHGEASLPFGAFASRLYIFHDDGLPVDGAEPVDAAEIAAIEEQAHASWAAGRRPTAAAAQEAR